MQKRPSSISSSAEDVAGSIDTLTEILLRLPVKPLLRFKCVSKQWLSLISEPRFCHSHALRRPSALLFDHFRQAPNFPIVPLTSSDSNVRLLNLDFLNRAHVTVVRSCNGLLICYSSPSSQQNPSSRYFVCNPATRKFVTLSFPNQQFESQIRSLYLGFDPLRSPHFEVISIRILNGPQICGAVKCEINVYSSGTGSWSVPGVYLPAPVCMMAGGGVYYNRAIHWCNGAGETLYFDIDSQSLKRLQVPVNRAEYRGILGTESQTVRYFGESGGHLHLILSKRKESLEFDLWELREEFSGWSFRHHVDLNPLQVEFPDLKWDLVNFAQPFYIVCKAEEENSMFVLFVGGTAISCNPVNCSSRKICDFKLDMTLLDAIIYDLSVEIFQYFESLSCIGAFTAYS